MGGEQFALLPGDILEVEFEHKTTKCQLKFMMENELIE